MNGERYECERCGYVLGSWDKMSNKYLDIAMEKVIKQEVNDVLDKIRAEIADIYCSQYCENPYTAVAVRKMALEIIDKYKPESE